MKSLREIRSELVTEASKPKYKKTHFSKIDKQYDNPSKLLSDLESNANGYKVYDDLTGGIQSYIIVPGKTYGWSFDETRDTDSYIKITLTTDGVPYLDRVHTYNKQTDVRKFLLDIIGKEMVKRGRVIPEKSYYYAGYKTVKPVKFNKFNGKPMKVSYKAQPGRETSKINTWSHSDIKFDHTYGDEVEAGLITIPTGMGMSVSETSNVGSGKPITVTKIQLNKIINFILDYGNQSNNDAESQYWADFAKNDKNQRGVGAQV